MSQTINSRKRAILAVLAIAILMFAYLPATSEPADAADSEKTYGAIKEFSWKDVEELSRALIGESVEELIMQLSENEYGYELTLKEPQFTGELATKRDVKISGNIYSIEDHVSAYVEYGTEVKVHGNLPEPGTYERNDGEDAEAFLDRVLKDGASKEPRDVTWDIVFCVYVDADVTTKIDNSTGEMISTDVFAKMFIADYEKGNMKFETVGEDDDLKEITVSYEDYELYGNFYLSVDNGFKYEDMKVFSEDFSWTIKPKITSHLNHIYVSSDLANGLWSLVSQVAGVEGKVNSTLPNLILNIIKSGSRVLDLVETIKSLTGKGFKDIDFLATIQATNTMDLMGREYVILEVAEKDGSVPIIFPKADYCLTIDELLDIVPSNVLDDGTKTMICLGAALIGWDSIEVTEMDSKMEKKFDEIYDHTNTMIKYDEEFELKIPLAYVVMSAIGLMGCVAAVFVMRRRSS